MRAPLVTRAIATCEHRSPAGRIAALRRAVAVALLATAAAAGAAAAATATARIQYLSSASVYLDAGRAAGLAEGMIVRVERQGQVVAELVVDFVAQASASCTIRSTQVALRPGDVCTFAPSADAPGADAPATAGAGADRGGSSDGVWARLGAVRGSVSTVYTQASDPSGTYSNPAVRADLRWRGAEREELAVRVRADRPVWEALTANSRPTDVHLYEASARYASARERLTLEGGRLLPMQLELLGSLDGGSASVRPSRGFRAGVAAGRGADVVVSGREMLGARYGGFVEMSAWTKQGARRWRSVVAAARIDDPDITRRQFVQWRTDATLGSRVRAFENLELDVNPGWKRALGEPHVEASNWSLTGQVELHRRLDVTLGYDEFRDPLLPEHRALSTPFERRRTRGARAATRIGLAKGTSLRLAADLRDRSGEDALRRGWDASLISTTSGARNITVILHGALYDTQQGTGRLADGGLALQAARWLRVDVAAGTSRHEDPIAAAAGELQDSVGWVRGGLDVQAGMGLWLGAVGEWRDHAGGRELTLELGRQF
jgi:hypothetical protein